ncbi:hypothetical protein Tco_0526427 [Tanacetum coccineum]
MSSSTVTYTSISFESNLPPWGFHLMDPDEFEAPLSPEQTPPSPDYVPGPEYPEYVAPSNDEIPVGDQPLPADASPITISPGYVADSGPLEEDPKDDPKEDPADYSSNGGDDDEEEERSSEDDDDDKEEGEASEEDEEEEEEHLALADSVALLVIDHFASAPTPTSPPSSPLLPLSSLLPRIPSPPLHTSPTYAKGPLGYIAAMIQLRAASPSTYHPLHVPSPPLLLPSTAHRTDIPEAEMPPRKRVYFIAPTRRVDYGFIDTMDASIQASGSRVMTVVEEVIERLRSPLLTRERRYFCSMASSYEREVVYARQAWSRSEDRSTALEASIRTLEAHVGHYRLNINDGVAEAECGQIVKWQKDRVALLRGHLQCSLEIPTLNFKGTEGVVELALEYGEGFQKNTDEVGKYVRDPLHDPGKQTENKRKHIYNTRNNHTQQKPLIEDIYLLMTIDVVEFFEGWKPLSPLQLAVEEVMSE